jgi:hypothetical protein
MSTQAILLVATIIFCCDVHQNSDVRSGTSSDDYLEDPLTRSMLKYENVLKLSNTIIDNLMTYQYDAALGVFNDDKLNAVPAKDIILSFVANVEKNVGPITWYKKMQWHFFHNKQSADKIAYLIKIVEHEKVTLKYVFVFDYGSENLTVIDFYVKKRGSVYRSPRDF